MYESVCVGCRFAQWKEDPKWEKLWGRKYGDCQHPVAVMLRADTPGCVRLDIPLTYDIHVDCISSHGGVSYCKAKEEA